MCRTDSQNHFQTLWGCFTLGSCVPRMALIEIGPRKQRETYETARSVQSNSVSEIRNQGNLDRRPDSVLDPSSLLAKFATVIQEWLLPGEAYENFPLLLRKVLKFQNTQKISTHPQTKVLAITLQGLNMWIFRKKRKRERKKKKTWPRNTWHKSHHSLQEITSGQPILMGLEGCQRKQPEWTCRSLPLVGLLQLGWDCWLLGLGFSRIN